MKRQRGRGRKSGNPANRSYESNGPEVKIRGNASQIYDKYLQLARDSMSSGDRVRAENLYQHAEHYYRIVQANQPKRDPNQEDAGEGGDATAEDGQDQGQHSSRDSRSRRSRGRNRDQDNRDQDQSADPLDVVTPEGDASSVEAGDEDAAPEGEGSEQSAPRRRTRRPRRSRSENTESAAGDSDAEAALASAGASAEEPTGGDDATEAA